MKQIILFFILFISLVSAGFSSAQSPPLVHARLKIEGVQKKCSVVAIREGLLSVPGVKKVDFDIPKYWLFFNDYEKMHAIVEFEQGTLTSETLIQAVEASSKQENIYKVKFVE